MKIDYTLENTDGAIKYAQSRGNGDKRGKKQKTQHNIGKSSIKVAMVIVH